MAANDFYVEVQGIKEIERTLKSFGTDVAIKITKKALRAGAKIILTEAQSKVPVKTGKLRDSLKITSRKKGDRFSYAVGTSNNKNLFVGKTFYAGFIEYGAPARGLPARPFMRPAFDAKSAEAVKAIMDAYAKAIKSWRKKAGITV